MCARQPEVCQFARNFVIITCPVAEFVGLIPCEYFYRIPPSPSQGIDGAGFKNLRGIPTKSRLRDDASRSLAWPQIAVIRSAIKSVCASAAIDTLSKSSCRPKMMSLDIPMRLFCLRFQSIASPAEFNMQGLFSRVPFTNRFCVLCINFLFFSNIAALTEDFATLKYGVESIIYDAHLKVKH